MRAGFPVTVLAAILLGAASTAGVVVFARVSMSGIPESTEVLLLRGGDAWHGSERGTALIRWINVETVGPLVAAARWGDVPQWAEPGSADGARHVRVAAVAVGWPLPAVAARWRAERADEGFPPPAERETSGDAPKEAMRRLFGSDPHADRSILWTGTAIDALALGVPWWVVLRIIARLRAARGAVTLQE